jgi:hypothetical protein
MERGADMTGEEREEEETLCFMGFSGGRFKELG